MGTHKIEIKNIKVEANTAMDCVVLFDRAIQYLKILDMPTQMLQACVNCGSFDIIAESPDRYECQVCRALVTMLTDDDETIIEIELEDEGEKE